MSIFVDSYRSLPKPALAGCARYCRLVFLVATFHWLVPSVALATVSEPLEIGTEPATKSATESATLADSTEIPKQEAESGLDHAPALNTEVCAPDGVAIDGYDLVSYHESAAPRLGKIAIFAEHLGLTYRFASPKNRLAFLADPGKYLPSYRGWCSTNLSMGRLACPDYTNYKLEDGKLLFFERVGFTNGLDIWNSDPFRHRRQANQNFALLSGQ